MRIKQEAKGEFGAPPKARDLKSLLERGLINLDKPTGPSSHQVTHWVKQILKAEKAGHGGTLDPNATGVLPIALGKATKALKLLLNEKKEYIGLVVLHGKVKKSKVKEVLKKFEGKIKQVPPVKSSVKRKEREREIYEIKLLELKEKNLLFKVECEAGTYIRKLAHSIGERLGVGAHLKELRRTEVGSFIEREAVSLYELEDSYKLWEEEGSSRPLRECIKPVEFIVKDLPKIYIQDTAIRSVSQGTPLYAPGVSKFSESIEKGDEVALMTLKGELIGLGKAEVPAEEILEKKKGVVSTIDSVILDIKEKSDS